MLHNIFFWLYRQTWLLGLLWALIISLITLFSSYHTCTDNVSWLSTLFLVAIVLFATQAIIILLFSLLQKSKIRHNLKNGKDKFDSISMIDEKHDKTVWVDSDQKNLLVLPLYIIGLYSLSKIIVVWAKNSAPIENNMYLYILWGIICIISSWLWFALKEYAEEKNKYSIKYTIIITLITLASIYWNLLTPYIADLIEVIKCVVNQITLKK